MPNACFLQCSSKSQRWAVAGSTVKRSILNKVGSGKRLANELELMFRVLDIMALGLICFRLFFELLSAGQ